MIIEEKRNIVKEMIHEYVRSKATVKCNMYGIATKTSMVFNDMRFNVGDRKHIVVDWSEVTNGYCAFKRIVDEVDEWIEDNSKRSDDVVLMTNNPYKEALNSIYGTRAFAKYVENDLNSTKQYFEWVKHNIINGCYAYKKPNSDKIKKVIFNPPATIVFWMDGTKTVVKAHGDDEYDPEKGMAMAFSKKFLGNEYEYYNVFKHWLKLCKVKGE